MNDGLKILTYLPQRFLKVKSHNLIDLMDRPTLFHLKGQKKSALFLSVLLHGNEFSGLSILQRILKRYRGRKLPRDLLIFIGNPKAAALGLRHLDDQPDFNRIWRGRKLPEHKAARALIKYIRAQTLYAAVDIHNNSGINPIYSCITEKKKEFVKLAQVFSKNVVYFKQPDTVLSAAMGCFCPAVTIECGLPGNAYGVTSGVRFVQEILDEKELWRKSSLQLKSVYHTYASLKLATDSVILFQSSRRFKVFPQNCHLLLTNQFDSLNFKKLKKGFSLGWLKSREKLQLIDQKGRDIFDQVFYLKGERLLVRSPFIPSMFTKDVSIAKSDCLGYIMTKIDLDLTNS